MSKHTTNAGLLRRLAANFYDLLLLTAILFVASAIAVAINYSINHDCAVNGQCPVSHPLFYLALLLITFVFYGWFWTHGGQTLGMRSWRLKLTTSGGKSLDWKQAAIRFLAALATLLPAGAGLLWVLFDNNNKAMYDHLSSTEIHLLPKKKK